MPNMSTQSRKHRELQGRFAPDGSPQNDRLIKETEELLINTSKFLEHLQASEEDTRKYVEELKENLENDLRRLRRDRRDADTDR